MGSLSGLYCRTPPCCLDQAPPGEMWADGPPCSTSGLERSTVAMVRLQVHHWVRTKTLQDSEIFHNISTPAGRFIYEQNI